MNNGARLTGRHKDKRVSVAPLEGAHGTSRRELGSKGSWRSAEALWAGHGHKHSDLDLEERGATEGLIQRAQGSALRFEDGRPGRWEWVWAAGLPSAHPEAAPIVT